MLLTQGCFSWCWAVLTVIKDFSVSHALPESRTQGAEREHGQDSDLNTECHGQHRNWEGERLGAANCCLGMGWGQWVVSNCPVHDCFFLGFISFSFFGSLITTIIVFQSLNCSYFNPGFYPFFWFYSSSHWEEEWGAAWSLVVTSPSTSSNSLLPISWLLLQPIWSLFHSLLFFLFHLPLNLSCSSCTLCFASPPSSTILYLTLSSVTFVAKTTQGISGLRQLPHLQCLGWRRKIQGIGEGCLDLNCA